MNVQDRLDRAFELSCRADYRGAITEYDAVLGPEPGNPEVLYQRGCCRYALREFDEALVDFLLAMRAGPELLDRYRGYVCGTYAGQAERYRATGQLDRAVRACTEALCFLAAPVGGPGYLLYLRGNCHFERGDYDAAVYDYDAALASGYTGYHGCVASQRARAVARRDGWPRPGQPS
jgi:tetratricopeptide (TPR) repeat protein